MNTLFWEPVVYTSLSIFLTCTLFFIVYGLAYLGIKTLISLILNISDQIKGGKSDEN